jgi:sugar O-acyltransferase (sialic acid O-acetyltransferase NeuD family)
MRGIRHSELLVKIVILGAGGHARDVLDVLEACNAASLRYEVLGFVVEKAYARPGVLVNELPILGDFDWLAQHAAEVQVVGAVGNTDLRLRLVGQARMRGARCASAIVHPSAVITRRVKMSEGVVVGAGVTMTSLIELGRHVHVNNACSLAHDVVIGDFATLSPGARISGNVTIGEGAYVGTGATVIEKVKIGAWSTVGAGSAVVSDIPDNTTAVGCPARVIKQRPVGWQLGTSDERSEGGSR